MSAIITVLVVMLAAHTNLQGDDSHQQRREVDSVDLLAGNIHQRIPRLHLDIRQDLEGYARVSEVLRDIFALVRVRVSCPSVYYCVCMNVMSMYRLRSTLGKITRSFRNTLKHFQRGCGHPATPLAVLLSTSALLQLLTLTKISVSALS